VIPTPQDALRLMTMTPGLTLTLDYSHFTAAGFEDADIEPLVPHASHVHVRSARPSRLQAPFRENAIAFPRMLGALKTAGYQEYIELEYVWMEWEHCNDVDVLSETILLRDHLRSRSDREEEVLS